MICNIRTYVARMHAIEKEKESTVAFITTTRKINK